MANQGQSNFTMTRLRKILKPTFSLVQFAPRLLDERFNVSYQKQDLFVMRDLSKSASVFYAHIYLSTILLSPKK